MFRRFSTADLDELRRWELRQENAADDDLAAQSMLDYGELEEEQEPAIVQIALDLSQIELEAARRKATYFETLPIYKRNMVFVEGDGNFVIRKRNPALDIDTDTVPIYMSDTVTNLSGVRLTLPPQRAVSLEDLEKPHEGNSNEAAKRRLPQWKPHINHKNLSDRIITDEAWVMRTNAARNALKVREGEAATNTSPTRAIVQAIGSWVRKPQPNTWYDKMSQTQFLNGSELNLSVMAWEGAESAQAPSEHHRVVSVKEDTSPTFRRRRANGKYVRVLAVPQRVEHTWAPWEYDRRPAMQTAFTLDELINMRNEMILYKAKEMQVHPASRTNTHIYRKENFGIK